MAACAFGTAQHSTGVNSAADPPPPTTTNKHAHACMKYDSTTPRPHLSHTSPQLQNPPSPCSPPSPPLSPRPPSHLLVHMHAGPEPGLTRDTARGWLLHRDTQLQLLDTAGWKARSALLPPRSPDASAAAAAPYVLAGPGAEADADRRLAAAALQRSRIALASSHIAVLLLDAPRALTIDKALTRLELSLAGLALDHGRVLLVALNKADALPGGIAGDAAAELRGRVQELLSRTFGGGGGPRVLLLSGATGDGATALLDAAVDLYRAWDKRCETARRALSAPRVMGKQLCSCL